MFFSKQPKIDPRRRYGSRDFQNKIRGRQNYKRPYQPLDLSRKSKWLVILGIRSKFFRVLWVGILGVIVYFFVFSPYMIINDISVSGTNRVDPNQIKAVVTQMGESRWFFIPQSNFFLLTQKNVATNLTESIPYVKSITKYRRTWPNKVSIEIIERDPGFVLESAGRRFLVDDDGVVVNEAPGESSLPLVVDQIEENFDTGKTLSNSKLFAFILSAHKQWSSKIATQIGETKIPGVAATEVQFVTKEGWAVFFDVSRSVNSQLSNLALILNREIPAASRLNLAYIDMRLSKWAYYCYKDSPCVAGASTEELDAEDAASKTLTPGASTTTKPPPPKTPTSTK